MVWDLRPHLPTVRSVSSLPMAGLAYAVGSSKVNVSAPTSTVVTTVPSRVSSPPPPEYEGRSVVASSGSAAVPEELERALLFRRLLEEATDRSRYVSQGGVMLRSSQESVLAARTPEELRFARDLYLTSLDYILRGVPAGLSPTEKETLTRSLSQLYTRLGVQDPTVPHQQRSDPHTQHLFVQFCRGTATVIKLSMPRIRQGLESAVEFEKQYHVLERTGSVLSTSLMTVADRASRSTLTLPDFSAVTGLASGIVHTVSLGVWEGYQILSDSPSQNVTGE